MNQSERNAIRIDIEAIANAIANQPPYNDSDGATKPECLVKKVGLIIGKDLFRDLLRPCFYTKMGTCKEDGEEVARGNLYLTLTDELGLADFTHQYEKAMNWAEEKTGENRAIESVTSTLNIFAPHHPGGNCIATLRINFVQGCSDKPLSYVTEQHHEYNFEIAMGHLDNLIDNPQMPDIEERSIASPVYLVNSQQTKNTFGYTVKENRLGIYLMARRYGWSEVTFYGQQVLLKADVMVR